MRRSKLSESKQARLLEHFVGGATARCAANMGTTNSMFAGLSDEYCSGYYIERLREIIAYSS